MKLPIRGLAVVLYIVNLGIQSTLAEDRFEQAAAQAKRIENRIFRDRLKAEWLPGGKSFWYRVQTGENSHEFVLINAETGERKAAPELNALGLSGDETVKTSDLKIEPRRSRRNGVETYIKFVNKLDEKISLFWMDPQGERVAYGEVDAGDEHEQHTFDGHVWLVADASGEPLAILEGRVGPFTLVIDGKGKNERRRDREPRPRSGASPDGKWSATLENGEVVLRNRQSDEQQTINVDLKDGADFRGAASWSPDSSAFVFSRSADVSQRRVTIVNSSPADQLQPKLLEIDYTKPGDPLPNPKLILFRLSESGCDWRAVNMELASNPFTQSETISIRWAGDSSEFYFDYNQRGHQVYRIVAVNAKTGETRAVVEETRGTFIDYTQKTWRHWLPDSNELLWMSERDGWCHIWLYDVKTGAVKNQVTQGAWPVREVLHVDEAARRILFMAGGLRSEEDPYQRHLCTVNFDGSGLQQLTAGDGDHRIEFSPNRDYFIDAWSRVDLPPVHELRSTTDGRLICILEKSDLAPLLAAGWTVPQRFVAKARDGRTDVHGILIKPTHFDPAKKYPVVEQVYAGPQSAYVPKQFGLLSKLHALADMGFIIVQVDGLGTNHRGKAFHDVCWKDLKDAGFPDRIAWIKAAAESRPWMDLSRVGIYGGSAGGQNAMRALLDHHDFYKVAVADCGCHDNRMDKIWWNEQWMGWPIDESYARSSNVDDAHKLQGRLLLIVGELDTNVDPASTAQVVAALQKAGKTFDYMPIMGAGHGAAESPYGMRLRTEFLIRHLNP